MDSHPPSSALFLHEDGLAQTLAYEQDVQRWRIIELEAGHGDPGRPTYTKRPWRAARTPTILVASRRNLQLTFHPSISYRGVKNLSNLEQSHSPLLPLPSRGAQSVARAPMSSYSYVPCVHPVSRSEHFGLALGFLCA